MGQEFKAPKYSKDSEMILDCMKNQVIVFDLNTSGVFKHNVIGRRLVEEFPEYYQEYLKRLYMGRIYPGDCFIMEVRGYTLAGLVNHSKPQVKDDDDSETVAHLTKLCINKMIEQLGTDKEYVSGILGRRFNAWPSVFNLIGNLKVNWLIFPQ